MGRFCALPCQAMEGWAQWGTACIQKSHPDRGVVNLGRFEEGEWGELIHSLPFQYKGSNNSLIFNKFSY